MENVITSVTNEILNQIKKLNINKIVTKNQICTQDDFFMPGKEIYGMILILSFLTVSAWYEWKFLEKFGLFDFKGMTIEHRNIFYDALKEKFSSYTWVIIRRPTQ